MARSGKDKAPAAENIKEGIAASEDALDAQKAPTAQERAGEAMSDEAAAEAIIEAAAEVIDAAQILAGLQAELQEWKDKYLRLHADWDTYRRRTNEQRASEKASATEKLVEHLLPVIDDFERTIAYAEKNGEAGLLGGVSAVHAKLIAALEKEGVEILNPKGDAFHALECQAVTTCDNKDVPEETVAEVFQRGYKMGKKVLRPAMVSVTVGGPKRVVLQEETD
ncbi:MAG: nucleotide exchange factor GrpE [Eggerthellaceae bacterium]|nr:nucleotide exchange factor GrpE [Eggerthellaceae bacterium]